MATPEFVLEQLEAVPAQCRLCDSLLGYITTELLPLYEKGKLDERMVREDILDATMDCGGVLRFVSTREHSPVETKDCYFGFVALRKRLVTED